MFPIPFNFPFINKNGSRTTIGDAMSASATIPTASADVKGGVKIGSNLTMTGEVLNYDLPTASANTKGGVKIGSGINIAEDGTISVTAVRISPFSADAEEEVTP